jgi:hypothetical protein
MCHKQESVSHMMLIGAASLQGLNGFKQHGGAQASTV